MIYPVANEESLSRLWRALDSAEHFSDRFHLGETDLRFDETDQICFVAQQGGELAGFFVFNRYENEHILEKSKWFSDSERSCREMLELLKTQYSAYQKEFTFQPENRPLRDLLPEYGAEVYSEQQSMELISLPEPRNTEGVELLTEPYTEQYLALHDNSDDAYWTGEKVLKMPEQFRVFVAVEEGRVVGYLDVTCCDAVNNISDLYVQEQARKKGWGTKLLAKAIEQNAPSGMMLQVDLDNTAAIRLYERLGFRKIEGRNTIDAIWRV